MTSCPNLFLIINLCSYGLALAPLEYKDLLTYYNGLIYVRVLQIMLMFGNVTYYLVDKHCFDFIRECYGLLLLLYTSCPKVFLIVALSSYSLALAPLQYKGLLTYFNGRIDVRFLQTISSVQWDLFHKLSFGLPVS